ncbi:MULTISPECIES: DUF417 family protein [Empedobacter]|uniref:DUF417 family protein n=1 Tax=Empedobacter TaxID=59734 RepID=UPI000A03322C|nr:MULTISPECIES: DUF417 family protein [Empedobacter]
METKNLVHIHKDNLNINSPFINLYKIGYYLPLFGTVLLLVWIGIFKFTPTEAQAIKPLVENHPLSFWLYKIFSDQTVSNIVGVFELLVALLVVLTLKYQSLKKYAGIAILIIFGTTLSYLFTTPGIWKFVDGVPVTDFFILKDIAYFGFGFTLLAQSLNKKS